MCAARQWHNGAVRIVRQRTPKVFSVKNLWIARQYCVESVIVRQRLKEVCAVKSLWRIESAA